MLETAALLAVALLFGGMTLYAFGFAAVLFTALPAAQAGATLRLAFGHFYVFVMVTAAAAALAVWPQDRTSALLLAAVTLSAWPTRQVLMPAINRATDTGERTRFKVLHSLSVLISLGHIGLAGVVLARFL
jgi:hypothetical protein